MDASAAHVCALAVFQNLLNQELVKSIHLYRGEDGSASAIQREFMFSPNSYKQIAQARGADEGGINIMDVEEFMANLQEGEEHGLWMCIFHYNCNASSIKFAIPNILNPMRNPGLRALPELTNDLDCIRRLGERVDSGCPKKCAGGLVDDRIWTTADENCESTDMQPSFLGIKGLWPTIPRLASVQDFVGRSGGTLQDSMVGAQIENSYEIGDICSEENPNLREPITQFFPDYASFDLNQADYLFSCEKQNLKSDYKARLNAENNAVFSSMKQTEDPEIAICGNSSMLCCTTSIEELPQSMEKNGNKQVHRAPTQRVANIALKDLVKYFDVPITEASKRLKVGLTVLKRKCREFGIPRWPHRKIKSLNSLIQNLQEEAKIQEREDQLAAMAVMKRTRILETERQRIEKKPGTEIHKDTKRFRQDIFKRRHRANALKRRYESSDTNLEDENSSVSTMLTLMMDQGKTSSSTK